MCAGQIEGKVRARAQEVLGLCNTREMGGPPRGGLESRWAGSGDVLDAALLWLTPALSPQQWLPWSLLPPRSAPASGSFCPWLPLSLSLSLSLSFSLSPPSGFPLPHCLTVSEFSDLPPSFVCLHLLHLGLCLSVSVGHSHSLPHSLPTPPNVCGSHSLQHSTCSVCLSLSGSLSLSLPLGLTPRSPLWVSVFVSHSVTVLSLLSVFLSVCLLLSSPTPRLAHTVSPFPSCLSQAPPSLPLTWVFLPLLPSLLVVQPSNAEVLDTCASVNEQMGGCHPCQPLSVKGR